jgi:ABC-type Fe3+-siderophore transport system permease subunit
MKHILLFISLALIVSCAPRIPKAPENPVNPASTAAIAPPPPPSIEAKTGDKTTDAIADANKSLADAKASVALWESKVKELEQIAKKEQLERQQAWLFWLCVICLVGAGICVAGALLITLPVIRGTLSSVAGGFGVIAVLAMTISALIPYLMWVVIAIIAAAFIAVLIAATRALSANHNIVKGGDKFIESVSPEIAELFKDSMRGVMDNKDKDLVRLLRGVRLRKELNNKPDAPESVEMVEE